MVLNFWVPDAVGDAFDVYTEKSNAHDAMNQMVEDAIKEWHDRNIGEPGDWDLSALTLAFRDAIRMAGETSEEVYDSLLNLTYPTVVTYKTARELEAEGVRTNLEPVTDAFWLKLWDGQRVKVTIEFDSEVL